MSECHGLTAVYLERVLNLRWEQVTKIVNGILGSNNKSIVLGF